MAVDPPSVGGLPVIDLRAAGAQGVVRAHVAPGRSMMLLGAQGRVGEGPLVELLEGPPGGDAAALLNGGPHDFAGNAAFSFGGAILAPYANRIRGDAVPGRRAILADLGATRAELPRNWGGAEPGAAQYAMHGLLLDLPFPRYQQTDEAAVQARLEGWDFGGRWPSRVSLTIQWRLVDGGLDLQVDAANVGTEDLPMGIGWHPWFRIPSGLRGQARLQIPARARLRVNDYDEVLPTGEIDPVQGTAYDFSAEGGGALEDLYLDDSFVDLARDNASRLVVRMIDPAAGREIRLSSPTGHLRAVQVYAPPERPVVVIEPQFNLTDPFWSGWGADIDTGMAILRPGEAVSYQVRTEFRTL